MSLAEAARLIRAGDLVAFPTETVYGWGPTPPTISPLPRSSRPRAARISIH